MYEFLVQLGPHVTGVRTSIHLFADGRSAAKLPGHRTGETMYKSYVRFVACGPVVKHHNLRSVDDGKRCRAVFV